MLQFDYDNIKKKEKDLTQFKGWLPFRLEVFIDLVKREEYLKSEGLYDEIERANQDYMRLLRYHKEPQLFMEELIMEFIQDNPQFKGIVVEHPI